jgi:hypothetical protein
MPEALLSPICLCAFETSVSYPVSCNRFVELEKDVALPMAVFIKKVLLGSVREPVSLTIPHFGYVVTNAFLCTSFLQESRREENVLWAGSLALNFIRYVTSMGELLTFMFTPGDIDGGTPPKEKNFLS